MLLAWLTFVAQSGQAFDLENGQALHDEHCVRCHDSSRYDPANSRISNYEELRKRVSECELMVELAWFDEEVDDVTAYLNHRFYHFDMPK